MPSAKYIGNPAFRVHTHSGTLLRATTGKLVSTKPARYRVEVNAGVAPHAAYVIRGTRVMLGRDVVWDTMGAEGTRKAYMTAAIRLLGKGLRAQAAIRFSEDPSGSVRMTILAMENAKLNMHQVAVQTTAVMGATALAAVRHNMSLTDHTLADLARRGHPYARRHGSIRIHG